MPRAKKVNDGSARVDVEKVEEVKEKKEELEEVTPKVAKKRKPRKPKTDKASPDEIKASADVTVKTLQAEKMQLLRSMQGQTEEQKANGKERLREMNLAIKRASGIYKTGEL